MQKNYNISIFYFLLFSLLLLLSGILLFEENIGLNISAISEYYLGNEEKFIPKKSIYGVLKISLPHIFAFGVFIMVLLHFLLFTHHKDTKELQLLIWLSFISAFFELFSPLLILQGFTLFAPLKLLSFILMELSLVYAIYLLFNSFMGDSKTANS